MSACRLCREHDRDAALFKYGPRHYVHAECGFKKWGDSFLDKLLPVYVKRLPFRVCLENGWSIDRLKSYIDKRVSSGERAPHEPH